MYTVELNIGLDTNTGGTNTYSNVMRIVEWWFGYPNVSGRLARSATEDTAVVKVKTDLTVPEFTGVLYMLSRALEQDCIAYYREVQSVLTGHTDAYGELIGPNAASWGEFNMEYFIRY